MPYTLTYLMGPNPSILYLSDDNEYNILEIFMNHIKNGFLAITFDHKIASPASTLMSSVLGCGLVISLGYIFDKHDKHSDLMISLKSDVLDLFRIQDETHRERELRSLVSRAVTMVHDSHAYLEELRNRLYIALMYIRKSAFCDVARVRSIPLPLPHGVDYELLETCTRSVKPAYKRVTDSELRV